MHLDHGNSFDLAMKAYRAGYTSIMIDGSHELFDENIRLTKSVVDACHAAGVPVEAELGKVGGKEDDLEGGEGNPYTCLLYTSFKYDDKAGAWDRSIEAMKEVAKVAEELNIECCLEVLNRFETYIMTDCDEAIEYCKRVGSKNVNILLDTFHMNIEEDNLPDAIRKAGNLLGHLHVGEGNRKLPGMSKGSMPWAEMGEALREINYNKCVVARCV